MTSGRRSTNEPPLLHLLSEYDQHTWWIGAIGREAAELDFAANLVLRAMLQEHPDQIETLRARGKDLMAADVIRRIKAAAQVVTLPESDSELSADILAWADSLDLEERNRMIHDLSAASSEGIVSFDSWQVLSHDYKRAITVEYLDEVFTTIQQDRYRGTDLWTRADRAWRQS